MHVTLPGYDGGSGCMSGASLVEVIGTCVTLGIEVGVALISHFLRKQWFLSMIFLDPSPQLGIDNLEGQ